MFQYLAGVRDEPFRQKGGDLSLTDVFDYGDSNADNEVSLTEKNNEFKITFGLFDPDGAWHRSSGFTFECFSDNFLPSDYPTQLCGKDADPVSDAVRRSSMKLTDTLFHRSAPIVFRSNRLDRGTSSESGSSLKCRLLSVVISKRMRPERLCRINKQRELMHPTDVGRMYDMGHNNGNLIARSTFHMAHE